MSKGLPPFIADDRFRYGLRVGVELAFASAYHIKGGRMGAWDRESVVRDLWGSQEHEEPKTPAHINFYENCEVTVNNGLDAEAVERLIKLARD